MEPKDGGLVVLYGHGPKQDPYDPNKVKDVKAFDCKGHTVPVEVVKKKESASLTYKKKPGIVSLIFDNGYWLKTTDGYKQMTKREGKGKLTILQAIRSKKYAKALLTKCDSYAQPVGLTFEIIPEKDPFSVKPGASLPVKVLLDGKPLEGALFKIADAGNPDKKTEIKTDKNGKANIPLKKAGWQTLAASLKRPLKGDPDADILALSTSLAFRIK
jgi:nickel transport protein